MSNDNQTAQARRTAPVITYNSVNLGERIFVPGTLRRENAGIAEFMLSNGSSTEISVTAVEANQNRPAGFMLSTNSTDLTAIGILLERLFPRTVVTEIMKHYGTTEVIRVDTRHITTANRQLNIAAAKSHQATPVTKLGTTVDRQQQTTARLKKLADPTGRISAMLFHDSRPLAVSQVLASV